MGKRLLILGGSRYCLPIIDAAHDLGHEVVTMDYIPGNIAHRYSDRYENVSIVDKEAVCTAARNLSIDGIMSFAADPGVVSAAYTAEVMGLPFQGSAETVALMQNKGLFRSFLQNNGFNCPRSFVFSRVEEVLAASSDIPYPVIVKPTDSAGSKGCTRVDQPEQLVAAVEYALQFSAENACIIEEFVEKKYPSSDADGFTINGRFECLSFTSQLFDESAAGPYTPSGYDMPCGIPEDYTALLRSELQRMADLLHLQSGVYNIETRIGVDGLPYIMEVSPRGGGNRLSEMLRYAGGVDLLTASVQAALGEKITDIHEPTYDGFWHQQILHSPEGGIFKGMWYVEGFREAHVKDEQLWVEPGTQVAAFSAANHAFGTVFMRFDTKEELERFHENEELFMKVIVD